ncbi:MAG: ComEC/Rec2 family competence protein [Eubacteriales bacterium]|nr:ComEC/Rec2 family competence protein [Eubacteriales bacterium]
MARVQDSHREFTPLNSQGPGYRPDRPQSPPVLSLARPALGLAPALGLPGFLLYQKWGFLYLVLLGLVFLGLVSFYLWRLPWLKFLLPLLFLLNLGRAAWSLQAAELSSEAKLEGSFRLDKLLWESPATDQACFLARFHWGQQIALILPRSLLAKQEVRGRVSLSTPETASNPGGFEEAAWLAGQGVFLKGQLESLQEARGEAVWRMWRLQQFACLQNRLENLLPKPSVGLLMAICLGYKSGLTDLNKYQFRDLSLNHLTAVSGLHLAYFLAPLRLLPLARSWGKKASLSLEYTLILIFYLFTGQPPGLMRAGLLLALSDFSKWQRLRQDPLNSLALALALACLVNPFALLNRGVLWSFAAAAALFLFAEPLSRKLLASSKYLSRESAQALAATLATQMAISLLNLSEVGRFKLLTLLWQLPLTALAQIIFSVGLGLLAVLSLAPFLLTWPILPWSLWAGILSLLTRLFLQICQDLSRVNWPNMLAPRLNPLLLTALVLAASFQLYSRRRKHWVNFYRKQKIMRGSILALVILSFFVSGLWPPRPHIYFLDVGQGDAIVVTWGDWHLLIDGGSSDQALQVILPFMASKGISHFSAALLTHAHMDHLGAAAQLLAWGKVKALYLPREFSRAERLASYLGRPLETVTDFSPSAGRGEAEAGSELLAWAERLNIPVTRLEAGDRLTWRGPGLAPVFLPELDLYISQASLSDSKQYRDANESGLVARLSWANTSFFLTGDITPRKEELFLASGEEAGDLVKLGHHGAQNVSSEQFLDQVQPQVAIISVGANPYGHPSPAVLQRLGDRQIVCLRTDVDGAIEVAWNLGGHCEIRTHKSKKYISGLK